MLSKATPGEVGAAVVSAQVMFDRIRAMPDAEINIHSTENHIVVSAAGSSRKYEISTIAAADFPPFPERPEAMMCEIPGSVLGKLVEAVSYSVGSEAEAQFGGIYITTRPGEADAAASDKRTLVLVTERNPALTATAKFFLTASVRKAAQILTGSLGVDPIEVHANESRIHLVCAAGELVYALPMFTPMPLADAIETMSPKNGVSIVRAALLEAAKAVSVGTTRDTCDATVRCTGGKLSLQLNTAHGVNFESVETSGEREFECRLNSHLLVASLGPIDSDTIDVACDEYGGITGGMVAIRAPGVVACIGKIRQDFVAAPKNAKTAA
jgi:DNA polymerase III sliding clamp (beta) subunit (PCNA family)